MVFEDDEDELEEVGLEEEETLCDGEPGIEEDDPLEDFFFMNSFILSRFSEDDDDEDELFDFLRSSVPRTKIMPDFNL